MFSKMNQYISKFFHNRMIFIMKIVCLYFAWISLHYFASHLYVKICTPYTFFGFIMAPFIAPTPQCQALRWIIYNGGNNIILMWSYIGVWLLQRVTDFQQIM